MAVLGEVLFWGACESQSPLSYYSPVSLRWDVNIGMHFIYSCIEDWEENLRGATPILVSCMVISMVLKENAKFTTHHNDDETTADSTHNERHH